MLPFITCNNQKEPLIVACHVFDNMQSDQGKTQKQQNYRLFLAISDRPAADLISKIALPLERLLFVFKITQKQEAES